VVAERRLSTDLAISTGVLLQGNYLSNYSAHAAHTKTLENTAIRTRNASDPSYLGDVSLWHARLSVQLNHSVDALGRLWDKIGEKIQQIHRRVCINAHGVMWRLHATFRRESVRRETKANRGDSGYT